MKHEDLSGKSFGPPCSTIVAFAMVVTKAMTLMAVMMNLIMIIIMMNRDLRSSPLKTRWCRQSLQGHCVISLCLVNICPVCHVLSGDTTMLRQYDIRILCRHYVLPPVTAIAGRFCVDLGKRGATICGPVDFGMALDSPFYLFIIHYFLFIIWL